MTVCVDCPRRRWVAGAGAIKTGLAVAAPRLCAGGETHSWDLRPWLYAAAAPQLRVAVELPSDILKTVSGPYRDHRVETAA